VKALPRTRNASEGPAAFLLELVMLAVLAWRGGHLQVRRGSPGAAGHWRSGRRLPMIGVLALKALVLAATAAAIYALRQHVPVICSAFTALANAAVAAIDRETVTRAHRQAPTEPVPPGAAWSTRKIRVDDLSPVISELFNDLEHRQNPTAPSPAKALRKLGRE